MNKQTSAELLQNIYTHRGSLDYCEFVVDPENTMSDNQQVFDCFTQYLSILNVTEKTLRKVLLKSMKRVRQAVTEELEKEVYGKGKDSIKG